MVQHYRPRPMTERRTVHRDEELMHYGVKGMKKGVRKDRNKGNGPLKNTSHTYNAGVKRGIINDTEYYITETKNGYGSGVTGYSRRKVKSKFRKDVADLGRQFTNNIKKRTNAYSSAFKKRASQLKMKVNNFFGSARKQLTR